MYKIVFYIIFTFSICYSSYCIPGYTWQNTKAAFRGVHMFDTSNFIICGLEGRLIRTNDGGKTFTWIETNSRETFYNIKFIEKSKGAVISRIGNIYITEDTCKTWRKYFISTDSIDQIAFSDEKTIFVCGKLGIFKSNDFGKTWKNVWSETGINIESIKFPDANTGFACGDSGVVLKTTNGGNSWFEIFERIKTNEFRSLDFYNTNYGVAFYQDKRYLNNNGKFIITRDGGIHWDTISTDYNGPMYFKLFNESEGLGVGWGGDIIKTKDFWKTYTYDTLKRNHILDESQNPPGTIQLDISSDNSGNIVTVGLDNSICLLKNKGEDNKLIKWFFIKNYGFNGVYYYDIVELEKYHLLLSSDRSIISESFDGGVSWKNNYPVNISYKTRADSIWVGATMTESNGIRNLFFKDNENGICVGKKFNSQFPELTYITSDGGKSWDTLNNVTAYPKANMKNSFGISIRNDSPPYSYYITNNFGKDWVRKFHTVGNESSVDVNVVSDNIAYILIKRNSVPTDDTVHYPYRTKTVWKLLKTLDQGNTFDTIYSESNWFRGFYGMKFFDINKGYLFGSGHTFLETIDGGITWQEKECPLYFKYDIHLINDEFILFSGLKDTIAFTTDKMKTWSLEKLLIFRDDFQVSSTFNKIIPMKNGDIFLLGQGRVVKLVKNDTITGKNDFISGNIYNSEIKITPQPVLDYCNVTLSGLNSTNITSLTVKIFNILGDVVLDESDLAFNSLDGVISIFNANTADLPKGIYIVRIMTNNYCGFEKFVKM